MPERAMLKNKLVFATKEHFTQKILYSCAVVGGEKGAELTGFGGSHFDFPIVSHCHSKSGNGEGDCLEKEPNNKKTT